MGRNRLKELQYITQYLNIKNHNYDFRYKIHNYSILNKNGKIINIIFDKKDFSNIKYSFVKNNINYFKKFKAIFVFQYCRNMIEDYNRILSDFGIFVAPIAYPPSRSFWDYVKTNKINKNNKKEYIANISFGLCKKRMHRKPWIDKCIENGNFFKDRLDIKGYVDNLSRCKWSLNLKGAGYYQDGKCYRESESLYMGLAMAYSYKPVYPFPFYANEHYLYLEKPDDIILMNDENYNKFYKKSIGLWEKYFSPKAIGDYINNFVSDEKYVNNVYSIVYIQNNKKRNINIRL